MIESGDVRYFCEKCGVLIEESSEDSLIRCPSCGKSIRRGVCVTWDCRAVWGRVETIVRWSNALGTRTLRSWRTAYF
jgi:predicted RNA-binding Zn-ribbon protein involved in translation (DUF1610 family)